MVNLNRAVGIGVAWSWQISAITITNWDKRGSGHMLYIRGWNENGFLIGQNSYGKKAGDNGHHYFSPVVINQAVARYHAYTFVDMDPGQAKKVVWSRWRRIWEAIKNYIKDLMR